VITKILHKPAAIAQHVVGGVARRGLHGAVAVIGRILPDDHETPVDAASPKVSTQPVTQPPSPKTTTKKATTNTMPAKKARAERTAAKKATSRPAAPKKPAATLDEDRAPVDADPVVYSSGPDVTTTVPKDDLRP
jgi:hypothetical protein